MGKKKINQLFKEIPDLFTYYKLHSNTELFDRVITIDGFSSISASKISIKNIKNSENFINILNNILNIELKNSKKDVRLNGTVVLRSPRRSETKSDLVSLSNFIIVFTGFRNKELEQKILNKGGKVTTTVSKKTTCVIAKNIEDNSSSIIKAKLFNIPIYSEENFCNIYHI
jgi:DNA ligase (NAD+)